MDLFEKIYNVIIKFPFKEFFFIQFMFLFSTTIIYYFDLYKISNVHQIALLISFYIFVSCFNKLCYYFIKEFKNKKEES